MALQSAIQLVTARRLIAILIFVSLLIVVYLINGWITEYRQYGGDKEHLHGGLPEFTKCWTGIPCVYDDVVDFRIIVITFNRHRSLEKLLRTVDEVLLDGHTGALEIWVDRDANQKVHGPTLEVARAFRWKHGPTRVHVQRSHAGIYGQWIDTWTPKDTREMALILEDDISVSKHIFRWIRAIHKAYGSRDDFAGASLTSDELKTHDGKYQTLAAPRTETAFMYKCIGTWGFSPKPDVWGKFQNWYHSSIADRNFIPEVPGIEPTKWYKDLTKEGRADTMWEQWFIYYAYKTKLFTVYNNLGAFNGNTESCLCINRREVGLHSTSKGAEDYCTLLDKWDDRFIQLPTDIVKLNWDGKQIGEY